MPTLPPWNEMHPLVVHFPIALLLTLPVLIVVGLFNRRLARPFAGAALLLMVLGTGALVLSLSTGEAAEDNGVQTAAVSAAIEQHEELAEMSRTVFLVLTGAFAVLMAVAWRLRDRLSPRAFAAATGVFLLPYIGGMLLLARTGHEGGRIVHELGIHAQAGAVAMPDATHAARGFTDDDD